MIRAPTQEKSSCPIGTLSTKRARVNWRPRPQRTVRSWMALRFVDRAQAIPRNTSRPRSEKSRSMCSPSLRGKRARVVRQDVEDERARGRGASGATTMASRSRARASSRREAFPTWTVTIGSPTATGSPTFLWKTKPTAGSIAPSTVSRPAPRSIPACPIARAARRATRPSRSERTTTVSAGLGQERRVVADARVAPLQLDHAAEALEAGPARERLPHPRPRGVEGGGGAGEVHHPGRELDGQRLEVRGPAALQGLDALGHLEGVAGRAPERLVHVGDEGGHPLAHALADAEHGLGQGLRLVPPAEEGPVPALHVEDEGVDPLRHLLAHDRGGDEGQALHGGGDVAQRVELAVGGGDLRGLADEAEAAVAEDRAQLGRGSGAR